MSSANTNLRVFITGTNKFCYKSQNSILNLWAKIAKKGYSWGHEAVSLTVSAFAD